MIDPGNDTTFLHFLNSLAGYFPSFGSVYKETHHCRPAFFLENNQHHRADIENKTASIEEIHSDVESDVEAQTSSRVQSRGEIKARKALSKLGLEKVKGITRVTVRRSGQPILAISQPDVFKSKISDTYIVFGEGQAEDANSLQSQLQAAQDVLKDAGEPSAAIDASEAAADEEDGEEVDETGVDANDIELVVAQANVSRAKAVKALKNNDNDIVNAIMVSFLVLIKYMNWFTSIFGKWTLMLSTLSFFSTFNRSSLCKSSFNSDLFSALRNCPTNSVCRLTLFLTNKISKAFFVCNYTPLLSRNCLRAFGFLFGKLGRMLVLGDAVKQERSHLCWITPPGHVDFIWTGFFEFWR